MGKISKINLEDDILQSVEYVESERQKEEDLRNLLIENGVDLAGQETSVDFIKDLIYKQNEVSEHLDDNMHVHWIGTATGTNTLTATYSDITAYSDGLGVSFKNTTNSTGETTLNINNLDAIPILKSNGGAVSNLKANGVYTLRYVSGNFILQGEGGEYGTATAADVRSTKTFGDETGVKQGTLDLTNLIATNIKSGVTIDGVTGNLIEASGNLNYGSGSHSIRNAFASTYSTSSSLDGIQTYDGGRIEYSTNLKTLTKSTYSSNNTLLSSQPIFTHMSNLYRVTTSKQNAVIVYDTSYTYLYILDSNGNLIGQSLSANSNPFGIVTLDDIAYKMNYVNPNIEIRDLNNTLIGSVNISGGTYNDSYKGRCIGNGVGLTNISGGYAYVIYYNGTSWTGINLGTLNNTIILSLGNLASR